MGEEMMVAISAASISSRTHLYAPGRVRPGRFSRSSFPPGGLLRWFSPIVVGLFLASGVSSPAQAASPYLKWDDEAMATVSAPPFEFEFELQNVDKPSNIRRDRVVRVAIGVYGNESLCGWQLSATPTLNDEAIGTPVALPSTDDFLTDEAIVRILVNDRGSYAVRIVGEFTSGNPSCFASQSAVTPYETSIELFNLAKPPPPPPTSTKVKITSSGPSVLVANTRAKSRPIRITFKIQDPEKRKDLLHSICMRNTYDCWFEDGALVPKPWAKRTSQGWTRTWDFWWEKSSRSACLAYSWRQPDVSVLLVVSNADGKVIGRMKHRVKLTCRA